MPQEEANQVMNHRRLWSAHLNPLSTELQGILKDLAGTVRKLDMCMCSQYSLLSRLCLKRTLLKDGNTKNTKRKLGVNTHFLEIIKQQ